MIKDDFKRFLKIWKGAKWSTFIRRALLEPRSKMLQRWEENKVQRKTNDVKDVPDKRDRIAAKPKPLGRLPKKTKNLESVMKLGWFIIKQTLNACTAYGRIMMAEIINSITHNKLIRFDPELQWKHQEATGASRDYGDKIQNAFEQFHKHPQGFPETEYVRLDNYTIDELKTLIAQDFYIGTGCYWGWSSDVKMTNYRYMKKTGEFVPRTGEILGGHFIVIIDYDETGWIIIESEKEQWGNHEIKGVFHCKFEYTDKLMSKYISRDSKDAFEDEKVELVGS